MHKNRITIYDTVAYKYAKNIVDGNILSGKYIKFECQRFIDDIERQKQDDFDWEFDLATYEVIMGFQKFFKFADGILSGQQVKLAPFQEFIVGSLYCWKHKQEGYLRYSKAYIEVARKNGKSMLLGFMGLIKALLSEFGQIFCVATKRDQSAIVINEIRKLLQLAIPEIQERYKIYGKAQIAKIVCELTQAELAPLSSDANTLDGLGVDLAIIDEFGAHPNFQLYEVMRSSQTYKPSAQIVIITTAYPNTLTSPAYKERCLLVDAIEGKIPMSDRYFTAIYELDEEDYENLDNSELWVKANPLLADFPVIMDKMRSDYEDACKDLEKKNLFLTKNLNIWIANDATTSYLDYNSWLDCQVEEVDFEGREVIIGVDMSKSTDLCGISIIAKDDDGNIMLKSKAFLPSETIPQKEVSDKLPYNSYTYSGRDWLTATQGKFVNQVEVEGYIRSIEDMYNCKIRSINFDSWGALHLMSSLSQDYEVVDIKMSYRYFSPTVKRFRELVYEGKLKHEYNPVLNFCAGNAVTKSDLQENILLDKKKSTNRIDLLVSAIIAYAEIVEEETTDEYGDYFVI